MNTLDSIPFAREFCAVVFIQHLSCIQWLACKGSETSLPSLAQHISTTWTVKPIGLCNYAVRNTHTMSHKKVCLVSIRLKHRVQTLRCNYVSAYLVLRH